MSQGSYTAINLPSDGETIEASDVNTDLVGLINEFNKDVGNTKFDATDPLDGVKILDDSMSVTKVKDEVPVTYTPVITTSGTAFALGNGTLEGYSIKIGSKVMGTIRFVAGNTTTFGTGFWSVTLPYDPDPTVYVNEFPIGNINLFDNGGSQVAGVGKLNISSKLIQLNALYRPSTYLEYINVTSTVPFTWGNSDNFLLTFEYIAEV